MQLCKTLQMDQAKIKFAEGKDKIVTIEGYASVFGVLDQQGDIVNFGAFANITNKQIPMFFNHATYDIPIGKFTSLVEDNHGLYVVGELTPDNATASNVAAALKHDTVSGLSIGFSVAPDGYQQTDQGYSINQVKELSEISVCTYPANQEARINTIKSMGELGSIEAIELWLHKATRLDKQVISDLIKRACDLTQARQQQAADIQKLIQTLQSLK